MAMIELVGTWDGTSVLEHTGGNVNIVTPNPVVPSAVLLQAENLVNGTVKFNGLTMALQGSSAGSVRAIMFGANSSIIFTGCVVSVVATASVTFFHQSETVPFPSNFIGATDSTFTLTANGGNAATFIDVRSTSATVTFKAQFTNSFVSLVTTGDGSVLHRTPTANPSADVYIGITNLVVLANASRLANFRFYHDESTAAASSGLMIIGRGLVVGAKATTMLRVFDFPDVGTLSATNVSLTGGRMTLDANAGDVNVISLGSDTVNANITIGTDVQATTPFSFAFADVSRNGRVYAATTIKWIGGTGTVVAGATAFAFATNGSAAVTITSGSEFGLVNVNVDFTAATRAGVWQVGFGQLSWMSLFTLTGGNVKCVVQATTTASKAYLFAQEDATTFSITNSSGIIIQGTLFDMTGHNGAGVLYHVDGVYGWGSYFTLYGSGSFLSMISSSVFDSRAQHVGGFQFTSYASSITVRYDAAATVPTGISFITLRGTVDHSDSTFTLGTTITASNPSSASTSVKFISLTNYASMTRVTINFGVGCNLPITGLLSDVYLLYDDSAGALSSFTFSLASTSPAISWTTPTNTAVLVHYAVAAKSRIGGLYKIQDVAATLTAPTVKAFHFEGGSVSDRISVIGGAFTLTGTTAASFVHFKANVSSLNVAVAYAYVSVTGLAPRFVNADVTLASSTNITSTSTTILVTSASDEAGVFRVGSLTTSSGIALYNCTVQSVASYASYLMALTAGTLTSSFVIVDGSNVTLRSNVQYGAMFMTFGILTNTFDALVSVRRSNVSVNSLGTNGAYLFTFNTPSYLGNNVTVSFIDSRAYLDAIQSTAYAVSMYGSSDPGASFAFTGSTIVASASGQVALLYYTGGPMIALRILVQNTVLHIVKSNPGSCVYFDSAVYNGTSIVLRNVVCNINPGLSTNAAISPIRFGSVVKNLSVTFENVDVSASTTAGSCYMFSVSTIVDATISVSGGLWTLACTNTYAVYSQFMTRTNITMQGVKAVFGRSGSSDRWISIVAAGTLYDSTIVTQNSNIQLSTVSGSACTVSGLGSATIASSEVRYENVYLFAPAPSTFMVLSMLGNYVVQWSALTHRNVTIYALPNSHTSLFESESRFAGSVLTWKDLSFTVVQQAPTNADCNVFNVQTTNEFRLSSIVFDNSKWIVLGTCRYTFALNFNGALDLYDSNFTMVDSTIYATATTGAALVGATTAVFQRSQFIVRRCNWTLFSPADAKVFHWHSIPFTDSVFEMTDSVVYSQSGTGESIFMTYYPAMTRSTITVRNVSMVINNTLGAFQAMVFLMLGAHTHSVISFIDVTATVFSLGGQGKGLLFASSVTSQTNMTLVVQRSSFNILKTTGIPSTCVEYLPSGAVTGFTLSIDGLDCKTPQTIVIAQPMYAVRIVPGGTFASSTITIRNLNSWSVGSTDCGAMYASSTSGGASWDTVKVAITGGSWWTSPNCDASYGVYVNNINWPVGGSLTVQDVRSSLNGFGTSVFAAHISTTSTRKYSDHVQTYKNLSIAIASAANAYGMWYRSSGLDLAMMMTWQDVNVTITNSQRGACAYRTAATNSQWNRLTYTNVTCTILNPTTTDIVGFTWANSEMIGSVVTYEDCKVTVVAATSCALLKYSPGAVVMTQSQVTISGGTWLAQCADADIITTYSGMPMTNTNITVTKGANLTAIATTGSARGIYVAPSATASNISVTGGAMLTIRAAGDATAVMLSSTFQTSSSLLLSGAVIDVEALGSSASGIDTSGATFASLARVAVTDTTFVVVGAGAATAVAGVRITGMVLVTGTGISIGSSSVAFRGPATTYPALVQLGSTIPAGYVRIAASTVALPGPMPIDELTNYRRASTLVALNNGPREWQGLLINDWVVECNVAPTANNTVYFYKGCTGTSFSMTAPLSNCVIIFHSCTYSNTISAAADNVGERDTARGVLLSESAAVDRHLRKLHNTFVRHDVHRRFYGWVIVRHDERHHRHDDFDRSNEHDIQHGDPGLVCAQRTDPQQRYMSVSQRVLTGLYQREGAAIDHQPVQHNVRRFGVDHYPRRRILRHRLSLVHQLNRIHTRLPHLQRRRRRWPWALASTVAPLYRMRPFSSRERSSRFSIRQARRNS
jgi:hypothetical protein